MASSRDRLCPQTDRGQLNGITMLCSFSIVLVMLVLLTVVVMCIANVSL